MRFNFTVDKVWGRQLIEAVSEIQAVAVGMMLEHFDDLLFKSAQRSGEYVANFRISVGGHMGGYAKMEEWRKDHWYAKGYAEAIGIAKAHNSGVKMAARGGGIGRPLGVISLHNLSDHAHEAATQEGRPAGKLGEDDPGNPDTNSALDEYIDKVTATTSRRIYVGKGTWNMYRDLDI